MIFRIILEQCQHDVVFAAAVHTNCACTVEGVLLKLRFCCSESVLLASPTLCNVIHIVVQLQARLSTYFAKPSAAEANTADNTDAAQQASLARLTMARIFSLRRTETMRRTQSDSLAADHAYRSISQRRADRAAQATKDAAAILQVKQESQSSSGQTGRSPNRQPGRSPHEHDMSGSHGHSSQGPHGRDNSGLQTARLQHEPSGELSNAQQRVDPNTDVFQLFDSSMSSPQGSGQQDRSGMSAGASR